MYNKEISMNASTKNSVAIHIIFVSFLMQLQYSVPAAEHFCYVRYAKSEAAPPSMGFV